MASAAQLASNRDAIRFENESKRYAADSVFRDWKSKVSDLQSQMRDNQLDLRRANRRYAQVAAQGGSGDYGINKFSTAASGLREKIEGEVSKANYTADLFSKSVRGADAIQASINSGQAAVDQRDRQIAEVRAAQDRSNLKNQDQDQIVKDRALLSQFQSSSKGGSDPVRAATAVYAVPQEQLDQLQRDREEIAAQREFEAQETEKSKAYAESIVRQEQDFIKNLLNQPLDDAPSLRGLKETFTPQQISAQRDATINSSMTAQAQNVAPQSNQVYLAKQPKTSPLAGFNVSNNKAAKQRVSGATLGGNSNRLTA